MRIHAGDYNSVIIIAILIAGVLTTVWAYDDAKSRGKPAWLVALIVMFLQPFPIGLAVWFALRPERPKPRGRLWND